MASAKLLRLMNPGQKFIIGYPVSSLSEFLAYASGVGLGWAPGSGGFGGLE